MKTSHFTVIKNKSKKITGILQEKHSMLSGMAISILSEKKFQQSLQNNKNLKHIYFTKDELNYCKNRASSLAGRFAAKKAIIKALQKKIPWKDINISCSQTGEPIPSFSDNINSFVSISISHEEDIVAAIAAYALKDNIFSVGIDAARIARFSSLMSRQKILQRILTTRELNEINVKPISIAEKWAGKEAVSKAIGIGIWHGASLRDIEILNRQNKATVILHGKILQQAKNKNLNRWELAFIKDREFVLAIVLFQKTSPTLNLN